MKTIPLCALVLALAAPVFADDTKKISPINVASTQSGVLMGTLGTSGTLSAGAILTLAGASAVQSTGHTK